MRVLIDGQEVYCESSVKIIHDDQVVEVGDEMRDVESHITCNREGVIVDVVDPTEGVVHRSMWQTIDDLVEMTH